MNLKIEISLGEKKYSLSFPGEEASIAQTFGEDQPVHFGASKATSTPLMAGGFIGDTEHGGSCNVSKIEFIPHCNGTHTESLAHLKKGGPSPFNVLSRPIYPATLITLEARVSLGSESYKTFQPGDLVVTRSDLEKALPLNGDFLDGGALLLRTLDNHGSKKSARWEEDRKAPYFTREAMGFISKLSIKHIVVDFPSLDRCHDGGELLNHREFFQDPSRTVTEMAYFSDLIPDGRCFVSISVPSFHTDAAPSRVVVYQAKELP